MHNNGKINSKYRNKTGYNGNEIYLSIDERYLSNALEILENYCRNISLKLLNEVKDKS